MDLNHFSIILIRKEARGIKCERERGVLGGVSVRKRKRSNSVGAGSRDGRRYSIYPPRGKRWRDFDKSPLKADIMFGYPVNKIINRTFA